VLTSHDPREAMAEADLVLGLRDGRMEFAGPVEELDPRQLEELYL
jgi:ABC-type sulfate/molybdate transport systems ATPase subunit